MSIVDVESPPTPWSRFKEDNEDEAAGLTPEKISELFNDQVKPVMLSQFPDFQRKVIDLDESIKQDLPTYGFPQGYKSVVSDTRPKTRHMSAYRFGSTRRIFI